MNLKKYDGKLVQIISKHDNKIYEGICEYNSKEYCYHEFGREEESLEIFHFLFYKCDIEKIKEINKFTQKYSEIEKETVSDIALLEQGLDDEDDIIIYRLLSCLEDIELNGDILNLLENLIKNNKDKRIINKAKELIGKGVIV